MTDAALDAVPAARREAARDALTAAFGRTAVTDLAAIGGGASGALTYRLEAGGRPYLMRLEMRRDAFRNPHQSACLQTAAEAGVAPPVRHLNDAAGVAIMDFVPQRPLGEYPGGAPAIARDVGALIGRLQATPTFPVFVDYIDVLGRFLAMAQAQNRFAPGLIDAHLAGFERLKGAWRPQPEAFVSSHNDTNPGNLLFDGRRLWLIDWETACRGDPLTDLAIASHFLAPTPDLQTALLTAWAGRAPDRMTRARFSLMRQFTRLYTAAVVFGLLPAATPEPETDLAAPTPAEFGQMVSDGRLAAGTPAATRMIGKVFLAAFRNGLDDPAYEDALAVVAAG